MSQYSFHNPYHFVPVAGTSGPQSVAVEDFQNARSAVQRLAHDRWVPGLLSGRLLCRLVTETPLVVGAHQEKSSEKTPERPTRVHPFLLGGLPAIPASSLRGMISALAEAASNSALRVLGLEMRPNNRQKLEKKPWLAHAPFPLPFFQQISKELIPLGSGPSRDQISIAEQLFGFVSAAEEEKDKTHGLAFRSRLQFGLARLHPVPEAVWLDADPKRWRTAQELASPKSPSPALYFKSAAATGDTITREDLAPGPHVPQGRKFYPPHPPGTVGKVTGQDRWTWEVHPDVLDKNREDNHRKAAVRPIAPGATFWFHLDFDNLTDLELGVLCYVLQPTLQFRHRLGLGKPLGLGVVRIDPAALWLVDRQARYARGGWSRGSFYHQVWLPPGAETEQTAERVPRTAVWPESYRSDLTSASEVTRLPEGDARSWPSLAAAFRTNVAALFPDIIQALELIGDPAKLTAPVHYPQTQDRKPGDSDFELEYYRWWQSNAQAGANAQSLAPLDAQSTHLPTLERNPPPRREQGSRTSSSPGNRDSTRTRDGGTRGQHKRQP